MSLNSPAMTLTLLSGQFDLEDVITMQDSCTAAPPNLHSLKTGSLIPGKLLMDAKSTCIGFAWTGFGSREVTGVAFWRSSWKLPPCPGEPMPATSKIDVLLAKAEPIRNGGKTSGTTYSRRKKKVIVQL